MATASYFSFGRRFLLAACSLAALAASAMPESRGVTLLSHYKFDGNLTNSSTFLDVNGVAAPHGTFRRGTSSASAVIDVPTFTTGVDGSANGAIVFDGVNGWVDVTTAGHPGATIGLSGTPTAGDPYASSGPGLVSGTVMAWVKTTNISGPRWIMGNLNDNPAPPFVYDTQAFLMGWGGTNLQAFPRASGPGSSGIQRFIVADPTNSTAWADGGWHHLAFKWNGGAEQGSGVPTHASVYINGVRLGAASTNYFLDPTDEQNPWQFPMAIGARNNRGTLDGFWDGAIDDLRIYAEALTDEQILAIYQELLPSSDSADFNGDQVVDGADFLIWQRGLGTGGASLANGDANGDGNVNDLDLGIWQAQYLAGGAAAATGAIPEPTSGLLGASAAAACVCLRRSRRTK